MTVFRAATRSSGIRVNRHDTAAWVYLEGAVAVAVVTVRGAGVDPVSPS